MEVPPQLPFTHPDFLASMGVVPYPGLHTVPGTLPLDFLVTFPPEAPALFSTHNGALPIRHLPPNPPCPVARTNFKHDVILAAQKYTERFPEIVAELEYLPVCWQDLYHFWDPVDIYIEEPGFLFHVLHHLVWQAAMITRRIVNRVEAWCMQDIHKLVGLTTLTPVKAVLDEQDWDFLGLSLIPAHEITRTCIQLDRQCYHMREMIEQFAKHRLEQGRPHVTEPQRLHGLLQAQDMCRATSSHGSQDGAPANQGFLASNPRSPLQDAPAIISHGSDHMVGNRIHPPPRHDTAVAFAGSPTAVCEESQAHITPLYTSLSETNQNAIGTPNLAPTGSARPSHAAQRNSSEYSVTETLASLRDDTESPIPSVALPGQNKIALTSSAPIQGFDVGKMFNVEADWTIAANEKRLIGIRIADAYDTATIFKSDIIPRVLSSCGAIESYRPQISDARLTFVSQASAQAALKFNGKSIDNGPSLIVYLIPVWDNSAAPSGANIAHGFNLNNGVQNFQPPVTHGFSPKFTHSIHENSHSHCGQGPAFMPLGRMPYVTSPATGGQPMPIANRPLSAFPRQVSDTSISGGPSAIPNKAPAQPGPVVYGHVGHPKTPHGVLRQGSVGMQRPNQTHRQPSYQHRLANQAQNYNANQSDPPIRPPFQRTYDAEVHCKVSAHKQGCATDVLKQENIRTSTSPGCLDNSAKAPDTEVVVTTTELGIKPMQHTAAGLVKQPTAGTTVSKAGPPFTAINTTRASDKNESGGAPATHDDTLSYATAVPGHQPVASGQPVKDRDSMICDNVGQQSFQPSKVVESHSSSSTMLNGQVLASCIAMASKFPHNLDLGGKMFSDTNDTSISSEKTSEESADQIKGQTSFTVSMESQQSQVQHCRFDQRIPPNESCSKWQYRSIESFDGSQQDSTEAEKIVQQGPGLDSLVTEYVNDVPRRVVAWIVGKWGSRIHKLMSESGCKFEFIDDHRPFQQCRLTGTTASCAIGQAMIRRLLADAGPSFVPGDETVESFFVQDIIADSVLKRHKADVARIESLTECTIKLDAPNELGMSIRRCQVVGPNPRRRFEAQAEVECIMDYIRMGMSNEQTGIHSFEVDADVYDRICSMQLSKGQGGRSKLNLIQYHTKCRIYFLLKETPRIQRQTCQIIGPHFRLTEAKGKLNDLVVLVSDGKRNSLTASGSDTFIINKIAVSHIAGDKCSNLRSLETKSGCTINLVPHMDPLLHQVTVTGPDHSRPLAVSELRRLADECKTRKSQESGNDELGLRRLLETVTAPPSNTTNTSEGNYPTSRSSVRLEDVERVPVVAKTTRQESESFEADIEVSAEDIRSSAAYVQKSEGLSHKHTGLSGGGTGDWGGLKAKALDPADAFKNTRASGNATEGDSTLSGAPTDASAVSGSFRGKKPYRNKKSGKHIVKLPRNDSIASLASTEGSATSMHNAKKLVNDPNRTEVMYTPKEDSTPSSRSTEDFLRGYEGAAPARKVSKDRKGLATSTGMSRQESTVFFTPTGSRPGTNAVDNGPSQAAKQMVPSRMNRKKSTMSMRSTGSSTKSKKEPNVRQEKPADGQRNLLTAVDTGEGDSTISFTSDADSVPAQGSSVFFIHSSGPAADINKAAAKTIQPSRSQKTVSKEDHTENKNEEDRGRKATTMGAVDVLSRPQEWPTLGGRASAHSFGGFPSHSMMPTSRIPSGRRDSMAVVASRASSAKPTPGMIPTLDAVPSQSLAQQAQPPTEYANNGTLAGSRITLLRYVLIISQKEDGTNIAVQRCFECNDEEIDEYVKSMALGGTVEWKELLEREPKLGGGDRDVNHGRKQKSRGIK